MSARPPLHRLKKQELVWLSTHKCEHGHTFLSHYACYKPTNDRLGFLDIETSNLSADFGIILSYCIKKADSKEILYETLELEDIAKFGPGKEDKRVVEKLVKDLEGFDKVVTYYGSKFDMPFIRTRALINNIDFPAYGTLAHRDLYYTLRFKFKLSSNRLENGCRVLLGKTNKTRIDSKYWLGGMRGDAKSLQYILEHNKYDVIDLEKLYNKVEGYARGQNVSI
jgi:uncharacterized protein YprB with RNaseH-like and TPR domain